MKIRAIPKMLEITYRRSSIGHSERQKQTLKALGLRKLNQTVQHRDDESIRGMIRKVEHLVSWREIEESEPV